MGPPARPALLPTARVCVPKPAFCLFGSFLDAKAAKAREWPPSWFLSLCLPLSLRRRVSHLAQRSLYTWHMHNIVKGGKCQKQRNACEEYCIGYDMHDYSSSRQYGVHHGLIGIRLLVVRKCLLGFRSRPQSPGCPLLGLFSFTCFSFVDLS